MRERIDTAGIGSGNAERRTWPARLVDRVQTHATLVAATAMILISTLYGLMPKA